MCCREFTQADGNLPVAVGGGPLKDKEEEAGQCGPQEQQAEKETSSKPEAEVSRHRGEREGARGRR